MRDITSQPDYVINETLGINQSNWDAPEHLAIGQINMHKLFRTLALEPSGPSIRLPYSKNTLDIDTMTFPDPLMNGRVISGQCLLDRRIFNDGLLVMHRGEVVHESYRGGMNPDDRHVIHSCTKSLCSMLVAIAIDQQQLDPAEEISLYVPEFQGLKAWDNVTLQHVLDMQAGIEYSEDYTDPNAHYWHYARAAGYYPPLPGEQAIGARAWVVANLTRRNHLPGTVFSYNSCLSIVLGMALEKVYQQPLETLFERLLFQHIGPESDAYFNTDPQGFPIVEGQMNLTLRDFARWAALLVSEGKNLEGKQILPKNFVANISTVDEQARAAYRNGDRDRLFKSGLYKNQFWVLDPENNQFSMLGIHGQFAWYDLNRQLMLVGLGSFPRQSGELKMHSLNTLWQGVAGAV